MRLLFPAICLLISSVLYAQENKPFKFQWSAKPVLHTINKDFETADAVYVTDQRINEYLIEDEGLFIYRTIHRIVHINSDKGIEYFNRIYLPFNEGFEMVDVKARTILPGGRIMELDRNNIKDLKDEDGEYKIFALEGLTKGCEVEYYYTIKKHPSFFGREIVSSSIPSMRSIVELITPAHLRFETRSYNGLPESTDSVRGEKRYIRITGLDIAKAEEEQYSQYDASLKRVEYKLSYNLAKNEKERLFTWNELAKNVHEIYTDISDKDKKQLKDLFKIIDPKGSDVEKISAIENYLKKNIIPREDLSGDDAENLSQVVRNKMASHKAAIRLYAVLLEMAGIRYQLVLTGDRSDYIVDRGFENWINTKNFLIWFPATKKFIAPTEIEYRYPWVPPTWAATNGLFCEVTTIGDFTTAIGTVKNIRMEDTRYSFSNMDVKLKLDKEDAMIVDMKQIYGGYTAPLYRFPFAFLPAEEQKLYLKEIIKSGTNSENMLSHSFENKELELKDPYAPFVIQASVRSTTLLERAGDKLIVKIGEVIGRQVELYEDHERETDIDVNYPHLLNRVIELEIPAGYKVKNPEDININEVYENNGKVLMGFVSSYTLEGNVLKITINESYNEVSYPRSLYEPFKKVINAAADFNKIVLVLEKV